MAANDVENKKEHGEERSTAAAHYTVPLFITDILTGRFALTKQMVLGKINWECRGNGRGFVFRIIFFFKISLEEKPLKIYWSG